MVRLFVVNSGPDVAHATGRYSFFPLTRGTRYFHDTVSDYSYCIRRYYYLYNNIIFILNSKFNVLFLIHIPKRNISKIKSFCTNIFKLNIDRNLTRTDLNSNYNFKSRRLKYDWKLCPYISIWTYYLFYRFILNFNSRGITYKYSETIL